jgi:glycosyltransferase involved in cell wall biosynthesis
MKVLFVALGTAVEACSRIRIHQHLDFLASRGVRATVVPFDPRPPRPGEPARRPGRERRLAHALNELRRTVQVARLARAHDLVVVQRILPHPALQRLLAGQCRALAFDFDDAIDATHAGAAAAVPDARRRFAHMLALADAAIASTPALAAKARSACDRVFVIPSAVDCDRYRPRARAEGPARETTIGWIGRDSTTMYLEPVLPVLERLKRAHPELRVSLVGALPGTGTGFAECPPWSLATELDHLARFDVGIMPLSDDEWARGKGGYKLLQYFACGIPAVASPVGANPALVAHGHTGLLARDAREWEESLSLLIGDRDRARAMGASGRRAAVEEHSLAVWSPRLLAALEEVRDAAAHRGGKQSST